MSASSSQREGVITSTFNNTIVTLTDAEGNVISWSSGGGVGFKGARKSTAFAAQRVSETAVRKALEHGLRDVDVFIKGPGTGREAAIRALQTQRPARGQYSRRHSHSS